MEQDQQSEQGQLDLGLGDPEAQGAPPSEPRTLALIDGANFMYRSYHAMKAMGRELSAPDGTPTGALMNFATMVTKAKEATGASALAILFESTTGNFRDKLFEGYKESRKPTPDDIKIQMNLARDIFPLMGVPVMWVDGFEADDVMCAYGMAPPDGWRVAMCSSDKDIGQAVGARSVQLIPDGWKTFDQAGILAKFGVGPEMIPQYLALLGDASDDIPGVDRCGPDTARKLLQKHGSIEKIYESIDTLTPKLKEGFVNARGRIPLLMRLTTADCSCGQPMSPQAIYEANRSPDWAAALEKLRPLGLGRLIAKAEKGLEASKARQERLAGATPRI